MGKLSSSLSSTVGRKLLMGLTGLGLVMFVAGHLAGNLSLLIGTRTQFNQYTHLLESLGPTLWIIELGLLALFGLHAYSGIMVWFTNRRARSDKYRKTANAGGPSLKSWSSVWMIFTGIVLAMFVVVHVWSFKYGPGVAEGYVQHVDGEGIRDLHRLVVETFSQPGPVILYCGVMILLGLHLRHGFWSAFQSLGAMNSKLTPLTYAIGVLVAVLIGLGFLILPVWIYINGGGT